MILRFPLSGNSPVALDLILRSPVVTLFLAGHSSALSYENPDDIIDLEHCLRAIMLVLLMLDKFNISFYVR